MAMEREVINESYALVPPYSYALIQTDPESGQVVYKVAESPLTGREKEITAD